MFSYKANTIYKNLLIKFLLTENQEINPLGPYTPEAAQAIALATDAIERSQTLLKAVEATINESKSVQKYVHSSVNDGLTKRVAESTAMKVKYYK